MGLLLKGRTRECLISSYHFISLNPMLLKNIAHVVSFKHFSEYISRQGCFKFEKVVSEHCAACM